MLLTILAALPTSHLRGGVWKRKVSWLSRWGQKASGLLNDRRCSRGQSAPGSPLLQGRHFESISGTAMFCSYVFMACFEHARSTHLSCCQVEWPCQLAMKRAALVAAIPSTVGTQAGGGPSSAAFHPE